MIFEIVMKENAISVKYVTHDLMLELLPIIDVFSMVLDNPNIPSEVSAYFKGFELVFNQFKDLMERHKVYEIKCNVGDSFDHNIHNGVEKVDTSCQGYPNNRIFAQDKAKGYVVTSHSLNKTQN